MTQTESIEKTLGDSYELEPYGTDGFLVHTGFTYHDGDELHIVLKNQKGKAILTDEGHTLMWLSYDDFVMTPYRNRQYQKILSENNVKDDCGRVNVMIEKEEESQIYLQSIIQALLQIADLRYLNRQNVTSTFVDDLIAEAGKLDNAGMFRYDVKIKISDEEYCEPTVVIEAKDPVLIFAVNTDGRAKETLISIMLLKENQKRYRTIAVIDEKASISEKDKRRLINRVDRPIMGLADFSLVMKDYLSDIICE